MSNRVAVMAGAGVLAALAALWYWFPQATQSPQNLPTVSLFGGTNGAAPATSTPAMAKPASVPEGYRTYRNDKYRFEVSAPGTLTVREVNEGGGASTITFQNVAQAQGFQIFVVPYMGQQVTAERFKQDVPSGVMQEPRDFTLAGVPARAFFSADTLLGETREVWFIRGGYLFEVTAPKPLDVWLDRIMQTWVFI